MLRAPRAARDERLIAAPQPLIGGIGITTMWEANWMVDRGAQKRTPKQAAEWLGSRLSQGAM